MRRLHGEIVRRWPVALLLTGRATAFYETLGWERWQGRTYTLTAHGAVPDDEHGSLMIYRPSRAAVPDLIVEVVSEDRTGDAWKGRLCAGPAAAGAGGDPDAKGAGGRKLDRGRRRDWRRPGF